MSAWEQVQKTIDYMEEHLEEDIRIEDLAELALLSPFYYQRLFHRLVKKPVAEYQKLRRMAKATEVLLQTDRRILDIAVELGFSSHEHFTRTFTSTFHITPEEYRRDPIALNCMTKPELSLQYILVDEGVPLITDGIVLEINREKIEAPIYYTGISKNFPLTFIEGLGVESGADPLDTLWRSFHASKEAVLNIPEDSEEIGVTYASQQEGYFRYFVGARADQKEVPEEYMTWKLPKGEYIVCAFEAENFQALVMDALYKAEQYLYSIWLPKHNIITEAFGAERYASHSPETRRMEIWLLQK